ncbi:hypothetical protein [Kribbella sp. NPDC023855]
MGIGLWALALTLVLAALASALRYKLILSVVLLCGGLGLGIWASEQLP